VSAVPRYPSSHVPKYRHHKYSGRGFVELDGRRHYLGPYDDPATRASYDRLITQWLANGRQLPSSDPTRLAIAELCWRFWEWSTTYYRRPDGTITSERDHYKVALRGLRHLFGATPSAEFGPLDLKTLRQAWVQGRLPKMRGPASRKYANEMTARVKRVFRWAVENEMVPPSVFQGLQVVRGLRKGRSEARERGRVRPVERDRVEALRGHVSDQVWTMIELQLLTGARSGEIVAMRPEDIDQSNEVWVYRPESHKTQHHGHEREIYLGPKAQALLRPFLLRPREMPCFSPAEAESARLDRRSAERKTPLSCGNRPGSNRKAAPRRRAGDVYTVDSYRRCIRRACEVAAVDPWHPHQLRHTRGTEIRKEAGLEAAQVILGHQSANVTQVYAERDRDLAIRTAKRMG
jgi:integrase